MATSTFSCEHRLLLKPHSFERVLPRLVKRQTRHLSVAQHPNAGTQGNRVDPARPASSCDPGDYHNPVWRDVDELRHIKAQVGQLLRAAGHPVSPRRSSPIDTTIGRIRPGPVKLGAWSEVHKRSIDVLVIDTGEEASHDLEVV